MLSPLKLDVDPGQTEIPPVSPLPTAMDVEESSPYPRNVSKEELKILQSCLQRWRSEVEEEVRGLLRLTITEGQLTPKLPEPSILGYTT